MIAVLFASFFVLDGDVLRVVADVVVGCLLVVDDADVGLAVVVTAVVVVLGFFLGLIVLFRFFLGFAVSFAVSFESVPSAFTFTHFPSIFT